MKKWLMILVGIFFFAQTGVGYEPSDVIVDKCHQKYEIKTDLKALPSRQAKNIILFIGDGMGLNHIYSARVYQNGPTQKLELENFSHYSLVRTCSLSGVTDSAAAGTALATGVKTYNERIGTGPDGKKLTNLLELAKKLGKSVGLVTTDQVVGATPATFALHQGSRYSFDGLAQEYLEAKPDLLMGGGRQWFKKKDSQKDLLGTAQKEGYIVLLNNLQLASWNGILPVLGLFAEAEMTYMFDRSDDSSEPTLAQMVEKALMALAQDPEGFFLMAEGARIDHASHQGDFDRMIKEVLALEQAVKIAKEFQKKNPETLLLVTADHETGGIKVIPEEYKQGDLVKVKFTTKIGPFSAMHSGQRVALFADGPGAELVDKAEDNTQIFVIIKKAMGAN